MLPATGRQQALPELGGGAPEPIQLWRFPQGRIIVASREQQMRTDICAGLHNEGHEVVEAASGVQAIEEACSGWHTVLILDSAISEDGTAGICRTIRRRSELGIIVLSRDDDRQSRIDALNAGADDYIPVHFAMAELQARVRAVLRRVANSPAKSGQIGLEDRTIDLGARKVRGPSDRVTSLTPREFDVLQQLVSRPGKPLTHHALTQTVWQRDARGEIEYLRVVIQQLRRKLEPEPDRPRYIVTERGVGYVFHMPSSQGAAVACCA